MKCGKLGKLVAGIAVATLMLSGCGAGNNGNSSSSSKNAPAASTVVPGTITTQIAYAGRNFDPGTTSLSPAYGWKLACY